MKWSIIGEYRGVHIATLYTNLPEWAMEFILIEIWNGKRNVDNRLNYIGIPTNKGA